MDANPALTVRVTETSFEGIVRMTESDKDAATDGIAVKRPSASRLGSSSLFSLASTAASSRPGATTSVHGAIPAKPTTAFLAFQTLGIIYGDIGTSPLYTFSSIFPNEPKRDDVIGALSLMIWSLFLVFIVKYVVFILFADDNGEGGTFALFSRVRRDLLAKPAWGTRPLRRAILFVMPILSALGVAALLADGILTPAISVLGAVQGITIVSPSLTQADVVGISIAILVILYLVQYQGTGRVTDVFSPVIFLWFTVLAAIGIYNINQHPAVFAAFSPSYAFQYFIRNGRHGWASLGAVFLTITGSEALFADLGHFNAKSIRLCAICFVLPSLLLCYMGQAARLIIDPAAHENTFYLTMPHAIRVPMLVLATMAAVIASQAIISATFSLLSQAIQLHYFPRLIVRHTSAALEGRVYIPAVNYFYLVLVIAVVAGYQNATALGYAYGVALSFVFFLTTLLYFLAIMISFDKPLWVAAIFLAFYSVIDLAFVTANLLKFTKGGYFTVMITILGFSMMVIWRYGRMRMLERQAATSETMADFVTAQTASNAESAHSVAGAVICFASNLGRVPPSYKLLHDNLDVFPEQLIFLTLRSVDLPYASPNVTVCQPGPTSAMLLCVIDYGYCDHVPVHRTIVTALNAALRAKGMQLKSRIVNLIAVDAICIAEDKNLPIAERSLLLAFRTIHAASTSIGPDLDLPRATTLSITNFVDL